MTLPEAVSWLTTPEITAVVNVAAILALVLALISLLVYLRERFQKQETLPQVPTPIVAQSRIAPRTWWEYLTNDLKLSPKARRACAGLYNIGWEQLIPF